MIAKHARYRLVLSLAMVLLAVVAGSLILIQYYRQPMFSSQFGFYGDLPLPRWVFSPPLFDGKGNLIACDEKYGMIVLIKGAYFQKGNGRVRSYEIGPIQTTSAIWTVRGRAYRLTANNSHQYILLDGVGDPQIRQLSFDEWKVLEAVFQSSRQNGGVEVPDFEQSVEHALKAGGE